MKESNYVKVRVVTDSKKEIITKINDDTYNIEVREKAKLNEANIRVRQIIAKIYEVDLGKVQIVTGHKEPRKIIIIK